MSGIRKDQRISERRIIAEESMWLKKITSFFLAAFICTGSVAAAKTTMGDDTQEINIETSEFETRLKEIRQEQQLSPDNADTYIKEAELQLAHGYIAEAQKALKRALRLGPLSPEARLMQCRIDLAKNDLPSWQEDMILAEACGADTIPLRTDDALIYAHQGYWREAEERFQKIPKENLSEEARIQYYRTLIHLGKEAEAEKLGLTVQQYRDEKLDAAFRANQLTLEKMEALETCMPSLNLPNELLQELGMDASSQLEEDLRRLLSEGSVTLVSIAPKDQARIYKMGTHYVGYYQGQYRILSFSSERSVPDQYDKMKRYYLTMLDSMDFPFWEGVSYSPDGRYAAMNNSDVFIYRLKYALDPVIIDLLTGEIIQTATYGINRTEGAGTVVSGFFSADGRYYYYLLAERMERKWGMSIYRYDLSLSATEKCCEWGSIYGYPRLFEGKNGAIFLLGERLDLSQVMLIEVYPRKGKWASVVHVIHDGKSNMIREKILGSANSEYIVWCGGKRQDDLIKPLFSFVRMQDETSDSEALYQFDTEREKLILQNEEADGALVNNLDVWMSPDGYYALLLLKTDTTDLYMLNLETKEVKKVKGLENNVISASWDGGSYHPIIEWNTDILLISTQDGLGVYRLAGLSE